MSGALTLVGFTTFGGGGTRLLGPTPPPPPLLLLPPPLIEPSPLIPPSSIESKESKESKEPSSEKDSAWSGGTSRRRFNKPRLHGLNGSALADQSCTCMNSGGQYTASVWHHAISKAACGLSAAHAVSRMLKTTRPRCLHAFMQPQRLPRREGRGRLPRLPSRRESRYRARGRWAGLTWEGEGTVLTPHLTPHLAPTVSPSISNPKGEGRGATQGPHARAVRAGALIPTLARPFRRQPGTASGPPGGAGGRHMQP
eukprot:364750-Chlamydomonas_euryale.AAC.7